MSEVIAPNKSPMKAPPIFALALALTIPIVTQAQDEKLVQHEVGLSLHQFGLAGVPIGFVYKRGSEHKFWRFEASHLQYNMNHPTIHLDSSFNQNQSLNLGIGFTIAREKRKPLTEEFTFFRGPVFRLGGGYNRFETIPTVSTTFPVTYASSSVNLGLGYTIGMMYHLTESVYVNAQISPMLNHSISFNNHRFSDPAAPENFSSISQHTSFNWFQGATTIGIFYQF